jgi:hypothetical protein
MMMTPDRKAELRAEMDELRHADLDVDNLSPAQEAWAEATHAVWGGHEITEAMERWTGRMLHLSDERRRQAIRSVYTASASAVKKGLV